ncbi:transglycosylase SLT domain-containing protein [Nocardia amikacinitolerans]|uniref:transglycosylase SLT domain-containing protein n=1 Tax=Nocardia amikacinitolerans TaxID=756689 RepID=UPI0036B8DBE9
MTLTIANVSAWQPDQIGTAGANARKLSEQLDAAVRKGSDDTARLGTDKVWSGAAADAANQRMDTEKSRSGAVSAALLELATAFEAEVGNLNEAKSNVLRLRDQAASAGPVPAAGLGLITGFTVNDNGTVDATARTEELLRDLTGQAADDLRLRIRADAANWETQITTALRTAESVATEAQRKVDTAITKLQSALDGLADPNLIPPPSTTTTPAATTPPTTQSPSKPNYVMSGGNNSYSGSPSDSSYSGGPSSSAPTGPMPTGDVAKWIEDAKKILIEMGYKPEEIDERAIAMIIQHESGGNPYAENRWDSNWLAGHPSKGIMQTIDSTFNAYKAPGHDDIWNPVDNIVAAVRYSIDRYGSVSNVPGVVAVGQGGSYQGY